ncbi:MAG TPA: MarC family protein [Rhizomicrobium sp.]|nr:MarC family protein [Rhizomicrobium sp.]
MTIFGNAFLLVYAALFPIVNPVGSAPLFLGLTEFCTVEQRKVLVLKVALNSALLLLGSMFIGSHVLEFFGISLPAVRIGGGLVVTSFGWKLLNSEPSPDAAHANQAGGSTEPDSFYPLTMPLTVGPGSIAVAITLGSQRPKAADIGQWLLLGGAALAGVIAIAITIYLCYRFAQRVVEMLGPSGTQVVIRLSAFILVCIGIEILWSGWSELSNLPR